ncbi:glycoside hydrolase family 92 protein [Mycolicibacter longobardus]|uniref:Alpha-1,2-mannosidase n=1 Tax=Mycolicibacter longobardus TaxID=1108812 RepID=A0A1X1YCT7_9MYCO|nr:glycoside hydrolase family 92 protein [Mycolicibacter longobardus]ORW08856.1 hypothetical protein AWC16_18315 [Mycolicibacter longobardus]
MATRGALLASVLLIVGLIAAPNTSYEYRPVFATSPVDYVNTLIGTGTGGKWVGEINNFPGPSVPFGMVQYSPDTLGTYAGYDHAVDRATGFSMTHASVGCAAFGDISMLPTTTAIGSRPWELTEKIAHDRTERGKPGYYTVRFPETGVTAELTATTRTGVGRFRYPRKGPALLYVGAGASLAGNSAATIQIGDDDTTITGWATSGGFCGKNNTYTVYFAMKFSRPFTAYGVWDGYSVYRGTRSAYSSYIGDSGGYVQFPSGSEIEVRTALSYVSVDGAWANLAAEGNAGFDDVRAAAAREWNTALSKIRVAGRDRRDLTTFYTALYHALLHPNTFNDVDGRYLGFDDAVHTLPDGHTHYANFSDWDTYRGLAALHGLLVPQRAADMAQSLVYAAEQTGAFPRWALANAATAQMTGDSVVPLIVNLHAFGATGFDTRRALHYMVSGATTGGVGRHGYIERPGLGGYLERGYLPQVGGSCRGPSIPSASITLEWSVDDFAIARFAEALGQRDTAAQFEPRAQYWQNLFNPTTGYLSPRDAAGFFPDGPGFVEPDPGCFGQLGYDEGNAEQYLWYVPHNVAGLVTAIGGRQAATERLDRFTKKLNVGPNEPYLWAGNEVGLGVPWLYNYLGQPWKTQLLVDRIRSELFGPTPDGVPGNDDLGAMASWYVWAALGLFPAIPGTSILTVNTPLFEAAEIALAGGKSIRIRTPGASGGHRLRYIEGLALDGRPTQQTSLPESIIRTGGELAFTLSRKPDTGWGTEESAAPPSFDEGGQAVAVNVTPAVAAIAPGGSATVRLDAQRLTRGPDEYMITGSSADGGIAVAPLSGRFDTDGSTRQDLEITVARSVPDGNHRLVLTTTVGQSTRTFTMLIDVGESEAGE